MVYSVQIMAANLRSSRGKVIHLGLVVQLAGNRNMLIEKKSFDKNKFDPCQSSWNEFDAFDQTTVTILFFMNFA